MRQPIPFGKYLLLERISVGGMAEVFKAKSFGVEGFEKILAIKRILPSMAEDQEFIEMFIDEAKIAGQLSHANICQIFELGRIGDNHFIAMEYVWGKDLLQIQNRYRRVKQVMAPATAAFAAAKICEGLDYAHRKKDAQGKPLGIIHRDVSPQNVLVSYEGEVKLIDFGIAKAVGRSSRTQAGVLKGKFGYMSPEQVRGLPIDRRSDVFAIGTILHELLTAERLFIAESDFATLEKVRNVDIRSPRQMNPQVPVELDRIVMRALAKSPDDRYQWANELQEELQGFLMVQEPVFTSKQLSQWMKETFAVELRREQLLLETYKRVGRDGRLPEASDLPGSDEAAGGGRAGALPGPGTAGATPLALATTSLLPEARPTSAVDTAASPARSAPARPGGGSLAAPTRPLAPAGPTAAAGPAARPKPLDLPEPPPSLFDAEPTTVDDSLKLQGGAPTVSAPMPDPSGFEEEGEGPTNIFDEALQDGGRQAPDPHLASQPTVIFADASEAASARRGRGGGGAPSVIIDAGAGVGPRAELGRKKTPLSRGMERERAATLWQDIAIGVAVAGAVLLVAFGIRSALRSREDVGRATLVVAVLTPRDADVHIRGQGGDRVGRLAAGSPATFRALPPGRYDVEVTAGGLATYRKRVDLRPGDAEVVTATFGEAQPASLKLTVKPGAANVYVDGAETSADAPIALATGRHELRISKAGFAEQRIPLEVRSGEHLDRAVELVPQRGSIVVSSEPTDSEVLLNGQVRGRTPTTVADLELGRSYRVTVRRTGYSTATSSVSLSTDKPRAEIGPTLTPRRDKESKDGAREGATEPAAAPHRRDARDTDGRAAADKPGSSGGGSAATSGAGSGGSGAAGAGGGGESGYLIANTQPWARVFVDGKDTGKTTPIAPRAKVALRPGKHTVSFVVGGKKFDYEINVKAGEDTRLIRKLDVAESP